jgi:hypothetical protein
MTVSKYQMDQCKGRYTKEKKYIKLPVQYAYFREKRCENESLRDELCEVCLEKKKTPFSSANQQSLYHGKVDEPYFENSWIFGSPRYLRIIQIPGNTLSAQEQTQAELAQRIARKGVEMKVVPATTTTAGPKKGRPKKTAVAPAPAAAPAAAPTAPVVPVGPKKVKAQKKVEETPVVVIAAESAEEPLEAVEVIKIQLRAREINGVCYWYDSSKDKVYEKKTDGAIGNYVGRYDSSADALCTSFPDSDVE